MTNENEWMNSEDSLLSTFHAVGSLIPVTQNLTSITPDMRVSDALELMKEHRFSQLPVNSGNVLLGVFSFRSFSKKALARQKRRRSEWLGSQPVEDFMENLEFVHEDDDWSGVRPHLDKDDSFFVGHRRDLQGMVTTMDVFDYFYDIASPFILLAEIEVTLRKVIKTCICKADFKPSCERSLRSLYGNGNVPERLDEMTFDNYVMIICNKKNWVKFKILFGNGDNVRKLTEKRLSDAGNWRNIVFHFRRRLEQWEREELEECRHWLLNRVLAFDGNHQKKAADSEPLLPAETFVTSPYKGLTYHERLARIKEIHPRAYESWTDSEEQQLRDLLREGKTVEQIAAVHQRQTGAIRARMGKLGLEK